ncbi:MULTISPECIES: ABC transporter ATP-binding protein [unclassified Bosea (in: a-proteobacteria)]|uniref:ABC transporter ATP-binding protein n=1 Tax=unclassified Bosea (in: a-proteobacteria) TaxID=2653178 RepID=UPI000F7626F3|nr:MULTISPECIES: ABC transporter ATP-binding protein [unclassified Bosea (in: a-proteobacteria)]AZO80607.1 ABC transporter ATP-binding protein [Bosea sp. Tri-49]RXT23413.1 ABC transporter ATP-binding protein [Bosea sp. Tri-39]RXT38886.1 ABC transporter ATP-binding protein [Bosea sp. Tri-54]
MLKLDKVDTNYGVVAMLRDVSFHVGEGELVCILGPNGAGKTTTFRAISALLPLAKGRIEIMGRDLSSLRTETLSGLGIGFVPEGRRLFADITVRDNIRLGYEAQGLKADFADRLEEMLTLFPRVRDRIGQRAGTLSGGEQAMVALARALVGKPKLVIMDEPSLGLSPKLIDEYFDTVAEVNRRGTTVVLIEQNAETALSIANRGIMLVKGRVVASGTAAELLGSDAVRHLYL